MVKPIATLLMMTWCLCLAAQEESKYLEIVRAEDRLHELFEDLYNPEIISDKTPIFNRIDSIFRAALEFPASFDYPWKKLDMIGKLRSDDGRINVYSWLWMVGQEEYRYSAYIQVAGKRGESVVYPLVQSTSEHRDGEDFQQDTSHWHGKIYYELITERHKRKTYYTLIGADMNNSHTSIKTLEVIGLQRGRPVFLKERFLDDGTVKDRVVFEYSSQVAMTLRYDERLDKIVFDHLAPLHPLYEGVYQFYGPDGSYDAYHFREGIWVREEDVDARNLF